jgi:hypothetical protein
MTGVCDHSGALPHPYRHTIPAGDPTSLSFLAGRLLLRDCSILNATFSFDGGLGPSGSCPLLSGSRLTASTSLHVTASSDYMAEWIELDVDVGRSSVVCTSTWTACRRLRLGFIFGGDRVEGSGGGNGQYVSSSVRV